jgi:hypothetical protein
VEELLKKEEEAVKARPMIKFDLNHTYDFKEVLFGNPLIILT